MHSDFGGGYSRGAQRRDRVAGVADGRTKLSPVTLIDIHHEAIKAGVLLRTREEISLKAGLDVHFGCHSQLIRDYNAWLGGHRIGAAAHAQQIRSHARQYVAWKGSRLWNGPGSMLEQPFYTQSDADAEDQVDPGNAHSKCERVSSSLHGRCRIGCCSLYTFLGNVWLRMRSSPLVSLGVAWEGGAASSREQAASSSMCAHQGGCECSPTL